MAYAIIDGRYRNLTWRIARFGYFYGMVAGIVNFSFILSLCFVYSVKAMSIVFILLIAVTVVLEFILVFTKDEDVKNNISNNK
ncbi:MAG: hypothetical protein K2I30_00690 [Clostridia bacterium]|nr:hypothetical protein [Clostridia bacterium]